MYENRDFHPLVAKWLTENGYQYIHEAWMPHKGRADFLAVNEHGEQMIVECKVEFTTEAITQLRGYAEQFEIKVTPSLALPKPGITEKIRRRCANHGIRLIEIETPYDTTPTKVTVRNKTAETVRLIQGILRYKTGRNWSHDEVLWDALIHKFGDEINYVDDQRGEAERQNRE